MAYDGVVDSLECFDVHTEDVVSGASAFNPAALEAEGNEAPTKAELCPQNHY
jgi:hypothetical protein